ncbi:unnamed protein product [Rotaria sp. Silwood2]|nr:unnamed protein product [Rotaria sp. Silwood2]
MKIPLDDISFIAARARYFRILDELRADNAIIFYQDETWSNAGDEKRSIWIAEGGSGRLKKSDTKGEIEKMIIYLHTILLNQSFPGKRLTINGIINEMGFHLDSLDIFTCDAEHTMDASRFTKWITETCFKLRKQYGNKPRICLVIDNATWHNQQTDDSKVPTRSLRKVAIQNWLDQRNIEYEPVLTKAELLEIAVKFAPPRRYKVDEAAQRFNVEILRLPVKHSALNPIELAWAGLKNYIRDNNMNFRLVDVHNLTMEYLAAVDGPLSTSYFQHIKTYEDSFKAADKYVQEVVDPTLDENDDETFDNDSNDDESVIDSDDLDDDDSSDT